MVEREREEAKTETAMIRTLQESVEDLRSKVDDVMRYEHDVLANARDHDYRLQRIEDLGERTTDQIAVIHRFMAAGKGFEGGSDNDPSDDDVSPVDDDGEEE